MQDLWFSIGAVFPLLVIMAAGFAARRLNWISGTGARQMNNCIFHMFLPLLVALNIMDTDAHASLDGGTLLYGFISTVLSFLFLFWLVPKITSQRDSRGVLIQGIVRSNYAIFGIPLVMMMYPDKDTSVAAIMVVVAVPVFNVMSTIALMVNGSAKSDWRQVVKGVLLNPLIWGTIIGFVFWQTQFKLPALLMGPLRSMGSIATPLALFLLGAELDFGKARANARLLAIGVIGRLIVMPLVFLSIGIALGIRDVSLATLIALFASPVAVTSYPMSQQLGGNENLAGAIVVFTTALSIITVFFWVFALKSLGFLS